MISITRQNLLRLAFFSGGATIFAGLYLTSRSQKIYLDEMRGPVHAIDVIQQALRVNSLLTAVQSAGYKYLTTHDKAYSKPLYLAIQLVGVISRREICRKKMKVISLDLNMPKLDGPEISEGIKTNEETKKIPVVVVTSSKEDPDIQECRSHCVDSCIRKPVLVEDIIKVVADLGLHWMLRTQSLFFPSFSIA